MTPEDRLSHLDIYHGNLKEKLAAIIREAERDAGRDGWNEAIETCIDIVGCDDPLTIEDLRALKQLDPS